MSIVTQYYSLSFIDLGDSNTIIYSNTVFVSLFAYCLLNEGLGVIPIMASILTALGVMIISKPAFITGDSEEKEGRTVIIICIYYT
jgi:drug/metabolite transporter (DMT)-like permease